MSPTTKKLIAELETAKAKLREHHTTLFIDLESDPDEVEYLGDLLRGMTKNLKKLKSL